MFENYTYEELRHNCRAATSNAKRWRTLSKITCRHYIAQAKGYRARMYRKLIELGRMG